MARWNDLPWREDVYAAAEVWKEKCFFSDGALFNDRSVWTEENFRSLDEQVLQNPIYSPETAGEIERNSDVRLFVHKLERQLYGMVDNDVIQLAAELFWFLSLISTIAARQKQENIKHILSWTSSGGLEDHWLISGSVLKGVANPGRQYGPNVFKFFVYMISMMIEWKQRIPRKPSNIDEIWSFADWWDQRWDEKYEQLRGHPRLRKKEIQRNPQIRHCLMFFLYPDIFERVVCKVDKERICRDFIHFLNNSQLGDLIDACGTKSRVAIDRAIFEIRERLKSQFSADIDFYRDPIQSLWGQDSQMPPLSNRKLKIVSKLLVESDSASPSFDETAIQQSETNGTLEGALRQGLTPHYYRERDPTRRRKKLTEMINRCGKLYCECCTDEAERYGVAKERIFEVHHKIPLATYDGAKITNLNEVAVLCANCHRMVHATKPPKRIEDLKTELVR